jgi:hypothetical protein
VFGSSNNGTEGTPLVELAIIVVAFLFLCWVAIQGFSILCAVYHAFIEDKENLALFICFVVCISVWWLL